MQEAYHAAEVRLQEIGKAVLRSAEALRLDAQEEYGVISADEYADRMLALEEQAGWNEAYTERDACRAALLAWGLRQTRAQWAIYAPCSPGPHWPSWRRCGPVRAGTAAWPGWS